VLNSYVRHTNSRLQKKLRSQVFARLPTEMAEAAKTSAKILPNLQNGFKALKIIDISLGDANSLSLSGPNKLKSTPT
jgi:hypothetical protein